MAEYDGQKVCVWVLEVILFEILTRKHPWNISNVNQMIKSIISGSFQITKELNPSQIELIKGLMKINWIDW
jgi:hypothetical protein